MIKELSIIFSIGIGLAALSIFYLVYQNFQNVRFSFGKGYKIKKFKEKIKRFFKTKKTSILSNKHKMLVLAMAVALIGTAKEIKQIPKLMIFGMLIGLVIIYVYQKTAIASMKAKKLKEAAILFEAIELYTKTGYSLYQAIRTSRILVNEIRPAIDSCLNYWNAGANKALQKLREELNLEEIDTLILLLINMESSGAKELENTIGKVAFNMEDLQNMKAQIKIANKPLIFVIYRMLPLASIAGIITGGLLYRTYHVLEQTGFIKF